MDFSIKQALGVAVVVIVAALILVLASKLNIQNKEKSESNNTNMWNNVDKTVNEANAAAQEAAKSVGTKPAGA